MAGSARRTGQRMAAGRRAHGRTGCHCRYVIHAHQFKIEDQVSFGWNTWMGSIRTGTAFCAVCELPGNEDAALAADLHAINAQVQAGHGPTARALEEAEGLGGRLFWLSVRPHHRLEVFIVYRAWRVIVGRVEFAAVRGKPNGVDVYKRQIQGRETRSQ